MQIMKTPSDKAMVNAAWRMHHRDGEIEIHGHNDPLPIVRGSRGDEPGAYVLAWIWIYDKDVRKEDEK
jgi:hypothetical protein